MSNAERRALRNREGVAVPRVLDLYSTPCPRSRANWSSNTRSELKGGDAVAREDHPRCRRPCLHALLRGRERVADCAVVRSCQRDALKLDESVDSAALVQQLGGIQGLMEKLKHLGLSANEPDALRASAAEFVLEGLHAHRRISRPTKSAVSPPRKNSAAPSRASGRRTPRASGRISGGSITKKRH